ncbi:hypothetical protein [Pelagibius sp.]|uniref:hypothetical protein n=1 Tax=Pelagibius sp. TaxID=1931238 RepID=UPI002612601D|nr:hypothetical protein [Pelagibius sp.]
MPPSPRPLSRSGLIALSLVLFGSLLLAGCSTQQIGGALGAFCHSAEPCTAYNSDGTPVSGRWYNPY